MDGLLSPALDAKDVTKKRRVMENSAADIFRVILGDRLDEILAQLGIA
jgi:hypothetical protein